MFRRIASLLSRPRVAGALVALLPVAVFANSAWNEYAMDDRSLVVRNPLTAELSGIPELWRSDYWAPEIVSGLYRPLVMTTYALNRAAWGLDPLGYHVTNIVMMGFMSWLVWLLFRRLTDDHAVSLGGALLFGSLAVHAEVVANTAFGRPELMAGSFFLGTLLCHIQRDEDAARRPWLLYAGGLFFYLCGLLSKESAVTVLGEATVIPELLAVIRGEHDHQTVVNSQRVYAIQERTDVLVHVTDLAVVECRDVLDLSWLRAPDSPIHGIDLPVGRRRPHVPFGEHRVVGRPGAVRKMNHVGVHEAKERSLAVRLDPGTGFLENPDQIVRQPLVAGTHFSDVVDVEALIEIPDLSELAAFHERRGPPTLVPEDLREGDEPVGQGDRRLNEGIVNRRIQRGQHGCVGRQRRGGLAVGLGEDPCF